MRLAKGALLAAVGTSVCGLSMVSVVANAGPPFDHIVSRSLASYAIAEYCVNLADGYSCRRVQAFDAVDLKGAYAFTGVNILINGVDYSGGGGVETYQTLDCLLERGSLAVSPRGATLDATLDPGSVACNQWGYRCDWDTGDCEEVLFESEVSVQATWSQPINTRSGQTHRRNQNAVTGESLNFVCNERGGDLMREGGFAINGDYTPFDGRSEPYDEDSFLWSEYFDQGCNFNRRQ